MDMVLLFSSVGIDIWTWLEDIFGRFSLASDVEGNIEEGVLCVLNGVNVPLVLNMGGGGGGGEAGSSGILGHKKIIN